MELNFANNIGMHRTAEPASANLWSSIQQGDVRALDEYLTVLGTLTNRHALSGTAPLTWAALTGRKEIAVIRIERGANVMDRNRDGGTALHAAAFMGEADRVDLLVQKGADVNATNLSGESPLKIAKTKRSDLSRIPRIGSISHIYPSALLPRR